MTEIERENYCKNCKRSIYYDSAIGKTCDINVENNGKYVSPENYCCCKVVFEEDKETL